jgi:hypothetical protein
VTTYPLETLQLDHCELTLTPRGNKYVLTVVDLFTRKKWFIPAKTVTAPESFQLLCEHVCSSFRFPGNIITDQGSAFNSQLAAAFNNLLKIKHVMVLANDEHEGIGAAERGNRSIEDMLRKYVNAIKQDNWDDYIYLLQYAENNSVSKSHSFTPDHLMFGTEENNVNINDKDLILPKDLEHQAFVKNLKKNWNIANDILKNYHEKMKKQREKQLGRRKPAIFKVGDYVWLQTPTNAKIQGTSANLSQRSVTTPFLVTNVFENGNVEIQLTPTTREIHKHNELRKVKGTVETNYGLIGKPTEVIIIANPPSPPKEEIEDQQNNKQNYNVESLVGQRVSIFWPSHDEWHRALVIGYNTSKTRNLLYYDERFSAANTHPQEDFYVETLFPDPNVKNPVLWKLLKTIVAPSETKQTDSTTTSTTVSNEATLSDGPTNSSTATTNLTKSTVVPRRSLRSNAKGDKTLDRKKSQ